MFHFYNYLFRPVLRHNHLALTTPTNYTAERLFLGTQEFFLRIFLRP